MCITADKYRMQPLVDLSVEKFKLHTQAMNASESLDVDLFAACERAYASYDATEMICKHIVALAVQYKLFNNRGSDGRSAFDKLMRSSADLATDIATASVLVESRHYYCAVCATKSTAINVNLHCSKCYRSQTFNLR